MGQIGFTFDQVFDDTQDTPFGQHIANRIQDRGGLVGQPLTQSGVPMPRFFPGELNEANVPTVHSGGVDAVNIGPHRNGPHFGPCWARE